MANSGCIYIKPMAKRHGLAFLFISIFYFIINLLVFSLYWQQAKYLIIFSWLANIALVVISLGKLFTPMNSYAITAKSLTRIDTSGQWSIDWQSIQQIAALYDTSGWQRVALPYVGIKLKSLDILADTMSARFASHLLHEQRPLVLLAARQKLLDLEQGVINFMPFKLTDGSEVTGPLAGFLHQATSLRQALGYDLYLPSNSFDRDCEAFAKLLRQCRQSAITKQNTLT